MKGMIVMTLIVSCLSTSALDIPVHAFTQRAEHHLSMAQRFCVLGLLIAPFGGGCAVSPGLNPYPMFDNSRDWGPSYLIGPPGHHFGYGTRVDDSRAVSSDLSMPPSQSLPADSTLP
jgi:hypothetical protein